MASPLAASIPRGLFSIPSVIYPLIPACTVPLGMFWETGRLLALLPYFNWDLHTPTGSWNGLSRAFFLVTKTTLFSLAQHSTHQVVITRP